ncbi:MAG: tetratricopeptide repeat protein, partial [Pseudonocardiaceae bacterium]
LKDRGELADAEAWYRTAAEAGNPHAANNLGVLLEQRGEPGEAEAWYRTAVAAGNTSAAYNLGVLLGQPRSSAQ